MERWAMDVAGPFPTTSRGNRYVLMIGDYFTKWLEAFSLPDQQAKTIADVLSKEVISRYGAFRELHSDQGRNFESQLIQELCQIYGIHKTRTTPLHPQSDGFIERSFRTMNRLLKAAVEEQDKEWDEIIPFILSIYRCTPHSATKVSPYKILFGREMKLPLALLEDVPDERKVVQDAYIYELQRRLRQTAAFVRKHLGVSANIQKAYYDDRIQLRTIPENTPVWLYDPQFQRVKKGKLSFPWRGPYLHLQELDHGRHVLQKTSTGKRTVVHKNRIYEFRGKKLPKWMKKMIKSRTT